MELKKITLSGEKQLSEKQQSLSRFITMHTGLPFTGKTYNEWQMWVDLNKDYAETIATEKLSKNEKHRKRNQRTRQNSQMVKMDYAALKAIAKKSNKTMTGANYALGQGKSYLANRHSAYDDMILADDAGTLAEFFDCDPADFIPDLQLPEETTEALDLIEQAQITSTYETSTIDDAEGKPIVEVQKPVAMDRTIKLDNPLAAGCTIVLDNPITSVRAKLTDRLQGFAAFTGRDLEEIVNTAVDAYLDNAMLMVAGM